MESFFSACWAIESDKRVLEPSDEPLWILGVQYDTRTELEATRNDIMSRVWLTYRRAFPALSDGTTTTDRGWGCMLRCAQMLLAEAGLRRHLGRAWRWSSDCCDPLYLQVLSMFEDQPLAPFSLHVMTSLGQHTGKSIGEWYGPSTVAHLIKRLPEFDMWNNYAVSVVTDYLFIVDEIRELSKRSHPNGWDPMLILIPLRLGMDQFNPVYIGQIQRFFQMPQSLGILGGTPSHALFLIGYVGNDVIFLDPHTTQDKACVSKKETEEQNEADTSYHCHTTPHMPFNRLDPSMAFCFLCNNEAEYTDLVTRLRANFTKEGAPTVARSLLELMDTRPEFVKEVSDVNSEGNCSILSLSCGSVMSDGSVVVEECNDGDRLSDPTRHVNEPFVSVESSQLSGGKESASVRHKYQPQNCEVAGDVPESPRTLRIKPEKNQNDSNTGHSSIIGVPLQDSYEGDNGVDVSNNAGPKHRGELGAENDSDFEFL